MQNTRLKFFFPLKRDPHNIPPIISAVRALAELGHQVTLFTYHVPDGSFKGLKEENFKLITCDNNPYPKQAFCRVFATVKCYLKLASLILSFRKRPVDVVWVGSWDYKGLKFITKKILGNAKLIYQFHEYEEWNFRYCRSADLVAVPEENRAWITFVKAELKNVPALLPNIPFDHPRKKVDISEEPLLAELSRSGNRIILYQGYLDAYKRCLNELIESLLYIENAVLVVMPAFDDSQRKKLEEKSTELGLNGRVIFIPYRPAPGHLRVVSMADVGIGLYRPTTINQIYCAPNRLYEFLGYGVPVVLPNVPAIKNLSELYSCIGVCEPDDPKSIANAINTLIENSDRPKLQQEAMRFWSERANYNRYLSSIIERLSII